MGACARVVVPLLADRYAHGRDWRDLAWLVHDHLPYSEMYFFQKLAAFNLNWHEKTKRSIGSYIRPKGSLLRVSEEPSKPPDQRRERYQDFRISEGYPIPNNAFSRWLTTKPAPPISASCLFFPPFSP